MTVKMAAGSIPLCATIFSDAVRSFAVWDFQSFWLKCDHQIEFTGSIISYDSKLFKSSWFIFNTAPYLFWNRIIFGNGICIVARLKSIASVVWLDYLLIVYFYFKITRETVKVLSLGGEQDLWKPRATVSQISSTEELWWLTLP